MRIFNFQQRSRRFYVTALIIAIACIFVTAFLTYSLLVTHGRVVSAYKEVSVPVDEPVKIKLNQRLLDIPLDKIKINPETKGEWRYLSAENILIFEHESPLLPDTEHIVSFQDVRRFTGLSVDVPSVAFRTEAAPSVKSYSFKDVGVLAPDASLSVELSAKNRGMRSLELKTKPDIKLEYESKDDKTFVWRSQALLPQGKEVHLQLIDSLSGEVLINKKVKIAEKPTLKSRPPEIGFGEHDVAELIFAQPILPASGSIKFSVEGSGEWVDDKTYKFKPNKVKPGERYNFVLPKGLRAKNGGLLEKEERYYFAPNGQVTVSAFSPHGQELSQVKQTIRVTFNQAVDRASAESRVKVSRGKMISKSWEGNTLVIVAENFGVQNTVYVTVDTGVKPIFGLSSQQAYRYSFTTEIPIKKLNVPMFYQAFSQSCEAANLRMALAYRGIGGLSDWNILQKFGYNPRSHDKKNNIWDDPQVQFVGDVKGDQNAGTGWGVYAEPVAGAARSYGREAEVQYGVTADFLSKNIYAGNPVVLWGIWGESATQRTWATPDGRKVSGPFPMHVRLVVGVKGKQDSPVGFYIHDPITGPAYWSVDYLLSNTRKAGAANQAVAVK